MTYVMPSPCNHVLDHLTLARCILPERHYGPCSASPLFLAAYEKSERLIDAAPAMANLLLKLQWVEGEHCSTCPVCVGAAEGYGHKPDCELATVLRAAGVLP